MTSSIVALSFVSLGAVAHGCSQPSESSESTAVTDDSVDEALRAVRTCQAQARDCFADGGGADCEEQLRACLASVLPEAGAPIHSSERDGAHPGEDPAFDAERPSKPDDDSGPSHRPSSDGGAHPTMPEAAVRALTNPVGPAEGGSPVLSCVDALRSCLATDVKPSTCAEQAQSCLTDLRDAGKH